MTEPAYIVAGSRLVDQPTECQSVWCHRVVTAGTLLNIVFHRTRFMDNPDAQNHTALLCDACVDVLGARIRAASGAQLSVMEPCVVRGKSVPAF